MTSRIEGDRMEPLTRLAEVLERLTGDRGGRRAVMLELDLTQGLVEDVAHDAVARATSRRRLVLRDAVDRLHRAADDPGVRGLVAKIGPWRHGLAWAQEIRDAVRVFRNGGKPTVAWAESFGEFGPATVPYYLASAFDEIWLQESGDVGLTGVAAEVTFLRGTLDKVGVEPQFGQRYEYKNAANVLTERGFTDAHREAVTRVVESAADQVVFGVAGARGLTEDTVRALVDRAPLTATEALEAGLVDHVGYRDQAYGAVREKVRSRPDGGGPPGLRYLSRYAKSGRQGLARRISERGRPAVALIHGTGGIKVGRSGRGPLTGPAMGADTVTAAFRSALRNDNVRAILFRVDSPGGSYVASDTIRREVELASQAGKPVVVSMGTLAASGGYFVSMAADTIVAQPGTLTGSIGVLAGKGVVRELVAKLGLTHEEVAAGDHALMFSARREFTDDQWDRLQAWLDRVYEDFTAKVAEHRGLSREHVHEVARGRVWTGADAAEHGLVDELGGLADAARLARKKAGLPADAPVRPWPHIPVLQRLRPATSSEDPRAAAASAWAGGWGSYAGLAARLGLPVIGPLALPYSITLY
jgi:protease IV